MDEGSTAKSCYSQAKANNAFEYFPSMLADLKASLMGFKDNKHVKFKEVFDQHWGEKHQGSVTFLNSNVSKASVVKALILSNYLDITLNQPTSIPSFLQASILQKMEVNFDTAVKDILVDNPSVSRGALLRVVKYAINLSTGLSFRPLRNARHVPVTPIAKKKKTSVRNEGHVRRPIRSVKKIPSSLNIPPGHTTSWVLGIEPPEFNPAPPPPPLLREVGEDLSFVDENNVTLKALFKSMG